MTYDERVELAGFLVHTVVSMLNYAASGEPENFDDVVGEIKRMLIAYLFSVATS